VAGAAVVGPVVVTGGWAGTTVGPVGPVPVTVVGDAVVGVGRAGPVVVTVG
jgi:hypothetical protein